jgi:hypothetical protein
VSLTYDANRKYTNVAAHVTVLRISAGSHADVGSSTRIDSIDGSESVNVGEEVGKCAIGTRLEGDSVTTGSRVECVYARKNGIGIFS